jgi:hypothetical protein
MIDAFERSSLILHQRNKTEEAKIMSEERKKIMKLVNRLYIRLGNETYGKDKFATSLPSIAKKLNENRKSLCINLSEEMEAGTHLRWCY